MKTNNFEFAKKYMKVIILTALVFITIACNKNVDYVEPQSYPNTAIGNFEAFWHGIDENYMFSAYDNVDWQALYNQYRPQVNNSTTPRQLLNIITPMFKKLIDRHALINGENFVVSTLSSETIRKNNENVSNDTINERLIRNVYLNQTLQSYFQGIDISRISEQMFTGIINDKISYVKIKMFGNSLSTDPSILNFNFGKAYPYVKFNSFINYSNFNSKGIIIDLRNNPGGLANEFYRYLTIFAPNTYIFAYQLNRVSMDKALISPPFEQIVTPSDYNFKGRIVIITNRLSASASELLTMSLKGLPNITVIGDTTYGATGPISDYKDYTGNFYMPNGWKIQLAQNITLDRNKQMYEGRGIPPDIYIKQIYSSSNDNVLDKAIEILSK
jgi:carboxyl-terminal processing protease